MTGSFPVVQFNSSQKPFVVFGNVPIPDIRIAVKQTDKTVSQTDFI